MQPLYTGIFNLSTVFKIFFVGFLKTVDGMIKT